MKRRLVRNVREAETYHRNHTDQKGFEDVFGSCEETILPEKDIDQSLNGKGSVAYKAVLDGETVGGVIVAIDTETQHNHLDLLYVKSGVQGKGIGKSIC